MGSKDNRNRSLWQDYSGANAVTAENNFYSVLQKHFQSYGGSFVLRAKPKEFNNIYVNIPLDPITQQEIHIPSEEIKRHGIFPDYAVDNTLSNKTIYIEVKRQDGWVEGGKRHDGRGNAHERSCKYFTPGLLTILYERSRIIPPALPFWTVFIGDITRDPCRVREITCWYQGYFSHYFFWRNTNDENSLISHFENYIKPILS